LGNRDIEGLVLRQRYLCKSIFSAHVTLKFGTREFIWVKWTKNISLRGLIIRIAVSLITEGRLA